MSSLDFTFTLKILVIVIIAFLVITAWDEVLARIIFNIFELERDTIWAWIVVAGIATLLLFAVLLFFRIEAHDVLGISETVDTILTGQSEKFVKGEMVHATEKQI